MLSYNFSIKFFEDEDEPLEEDVVQYCFTKFTGTLPKVLNEILPDFLSDVYLFNADESIRISLDITSHFINYTNPDDDNTVYLTDINYWGIGDYTFEELTSNSYEIKFNIPKDIEVMIYGDTVFFEGREEDYSFKITWTDEESLKVTCDIPFFKLTNEVLHLNNGYLEF